MGVEYVATLNPNARSRCQVFGPANLAKVVSVDVDTFVSRALKTRKANLLVPNTTAWMTTLQGRGAGTLGTQDALLIVAHAFNIVNSH